MPVGFDERVDVGAVEDCCAGFDAVIGDEHHRRSPGALGRGTARKVGQEVFGLEVLRICGVVDDDRIGRRGPADARRAHCPTDEGVDQGRFARAGGSPHGDEEGGARAVDARQQVVTQFGGQRRMQGAAVLGVLGLQRESGFGDSLGDIAQRSSHRWCHGTLAVCHHASTLYVFPAVHQLPRRSRTELALMSLTCTPGGARTRDLPLRRRLLYPTELRRLEYPIRCSAQNRKRLPAGFGR